MKRITFLHALALATLLASPSPLFAQAKTDAKKDAKKDAKPTIPNPVQPPDIAAPKFSNGQPDAGFLKTHEGYVAIAKAGGVDVLFLGDSITAGWRGNGKEVWEKSFAAYKTANFGIGGDRTQHVLWRITNGEFDGIKPKAVVLMIGTNNSGSDDDDGIAKGVTAIVKAIHAKSPATKVLLLAIFPRGSKPDGVFGPQQEKLKQVNAKIAKLHDGKSVHYLDIGEKFLTEGALKAEIMPDFLHLSKAGYQIWADAITPKLAELTK
ncbi:MAG: GDSL family lipase [Verrucomicrobia bacterium]|nr:GDSL family lipase [Verrucomicrobiota bacterium]